MNHFIITPRDIHQEVTIKKILQALDIPFEKTKPCYDAEFVKKIKQSEQEIEQGKITQIENKNDLANFLGVKK
ncbi:MAG: hypothetical protein H6Q20_2641 [Bacteroidetes bacterium]|nr:hypothetical protein [Bacteroidota bacterium]